MDDDELSIDVRGCKSWPGATVSSGSPSCSTAAPNEFTSVSARTEMPNNTPPTDFSTSLSMSFPSEIGHPSYSSTCANGGNLIDSSLHMMGFVDPHQWWTERRDDRCFSASLDGGSSSCDTRNSFSGGYMDLQFPHAVPSACSASLLDNIIEADTRMKHPLFENNTSLEIVSSIELAPCWGNQSSLQQQPYWDVSPLELRPPWQEHLAASAMGGSPSSGIHVIPLQSAAVLKKSGSEGSVKRSKPEPSSPLPNLKARREKLGDRITALQQLVSPFGKTDTASVLHEAIEKIKYLHDQVNVLSMPYMKTGLPHEFQQSYADKVVESEVLQPDLRSHGLCLVPVSLTFPASSNESMVDFWTPTFGGTLKWGSHQR